MREGARASPGGRRLDVYLVEGPLRRHLKIIAGALQGALDLVGLPPPSGQADPLDRHGPAPARIFILQLDDAHGIVTRECSPAAAVAGKASALAELPPGPRPRRQAFAAASGIGLQSRTAGSASRASRPGRSRGRPPGGDRAGCRSASGRPAGRTSDPGQHSDQGCCVTWRNTHWMFPEGQRNSGRAGDWEQPGVQAEGGGRRSQASTWAG